MPLQIFDNFSFEPDIPAFCRSLGYNNPDDEECADIIAMLKQAWPLARPKIACLEVKVQSADPQSGIIVLNDISFTSHLLAENLAKETRAWAYLITCGHELYAWTQTILDPLERYTGEAIMEQALHGAIRHFEEIFPSTFYDGKTANMNPGSLQEWPISQQLPLFRLLGQGAELVGITLTDSFLMIPNKSVSGLRFANAHGYVNCRLCPRERCPNRRAAYNKSEAVMMH